MLHSRPQAGVVRVFEEMQFQEKCTGTPRCGGRRGSRLMRLKSTLSVLVSGLVGCAIHLDDWPREYGAALCRYEQRCGRLPRSTDCNLEQVAPAEPFEVAAVRAGLVRYDPSAAKTCVQLLDRMSCGRFPHERVMGTSECRAAFQPTLRAGDQCTPFWPLGCDNGCLIPLELASTQTEATCGKCFTAAREGEVVSMRYGPSCGPGLYPASNGGSSLDGGEDGICKKRPGLGESCKDFTIPCLEWLDCLDSGVCGSVSAEPGSTSSGCSGYGRNACVPPAWCGFDGKCEKALVDGQACLAHGQCSSRNCTDGSCLPRQALSAQCGEAKCGSLQRCKNGLCEAALLALCR